MSDTKKSKDDDDAADEVGNLDKTAEQTGAEKGKPAEEGKAEKADHRVAEHELL